MTSPSKRVLAFVFVAVAAPACAAEGDPPFTGTRELYRSAVSTQTCPDGVTELEGIPDRVALAFTAGEAGAIEVTVGDATVLATAPSGEPPHITFSLEEEWNQIRPVDYEISDDGDEVRGLAWTGFPWGTVTTDAWCDVTFGLSSEAP